MKAYLTFPIDDASKSVRKLTTAGRETREWGRQHPQFAQEAMSAADRLEQACRLAEVALSELNALMGKIGGPFKDAEMAMSVPMEIPVEENTLPMNG